MHQGEPATSFVIILEGRASIFIENEEGDRIRVRSYQAGSIVGEIGLYSGAPRTATVTADADLRALQLTREKFDAMRVEQPRVTGRLDELVVDLLGRRLAGTNRLVASLLD
ncbi:MAG: cyclic nucleotide-binding domain-containing protein [Gammaproteobacteria bacterium]|nr:cyclic nucleotide-binding domain-containing protein [Gammaproteobacteria bacterium]